MGTGVPSFGLYSNPTGGPYARVWSIDERTIGLPIECPSGIILNPTNMGLEAYKLAVAMMMSAKISNRKVRFYAHSSTEGGCGADYVQLM